MNEPIGIDIQVKHNLQGLMDAVRVLEGLGDEAQELIGTFDRLSTGSQAVDELTDSYKKLQKEIEEARSGGEKTSEQDIRNMRRRLAELKAQGAALKELQRGGADPWSMQLTETMERFRYLTQPMMAEMPPEQRRLLQTFMRGAERLPSAERARLAAMQTVGMENVQREMGAYEEEQRALHEEERRREMESQRWKGRLKGLGSLIIGGSIVGVLYRSLQVWKELDRELTKSEARFGNIQESVSGIADLMGYTRREVLEFNRIQSSLINTYDAGQMQTLLQYARARGMQTPVPSLQLAEMTRYTGRPVTGAMLNRMTQVAETMGMGQGRIEEFLRNFMQLQREQARVMLRPGAENVYGVAGALRNIFGDTEWGRLGPLGMTAIQAMQQGIRTPNQAIEPIMFLQYGVGGKTNLWEYMKARSYGVFGGIGTGEDYRSNLYMQLQGAESLYGGAPEWMRMIGIRAMFPNLPPEAIERLYGRFQEEPEAFRMIGRRGMGREELEKVLGMELPEIRDFQTAFEDYIPVAERLTTAAEKIQASLGEKFGDNLLSALTFLFDRLGEVVGSMSGLELALAGGTAYGGSKLIGKGADILTTLGAAKLMGGGGAVNPILLAALATIGTGLALEQTMPKVGETPRGIDLGKFKTPGDVAGEFISKSISPGSYPWQMKGSAGSKPTPKVDVNVNVDLNRLFEEQQAFFEAQEAVKSIAGDVDDAISNHPELLQHLREYYRIDSFQRTGK